MIRTHTQTPAPRARKLRFILKETGPEDHQCSYFPERETDKRSILSLIPIISRGGVQEDESHI